MNGQNPILRHPAVEFYSGYTLKIAQAIRIKDYGAIANLLKQYPASARDRGSKDFPLLGWAIGHNDPKAFELLLNGGAAPDDAIPIEGGKMSLVSLATGAERPEFLELLIAHKVSPNGPPNTEPPLFTAYYAHDAERFTKLLKAGANLNHKDGTGKTVLLIVVLANDYQQALALVKQGADVHVRTNGGTSIAKIIEKYPLLPNTPQGKAQQEIAKLLRN